MTDQAHEADLIDFAAVIVCAYVANNSVPAAALPALIADVHRAVRNAQTGVNESEPKPLQPAVNPKRSVLPDYIVCLEDGEKFKSLKRHLQRRHDLLPDQYRKKWGLAPDYPMVAPNYASARSAMAKKLGLGKKRRRR